MRRALLYNRTAYRAAVMALNPVGYWRLGEAAGLVAIDEMGRNNLTYVNTPTLGVAGALSGDANTAAAFYVVSAQEATAAAGGPSAVTNWSMGAWIKPSVLAQNSGGFEFGGDASGFGFNIGDGAGGSGSNLQCFTSGVAYIPTSYTFPDTTSWHLVVATRDTTTIRIYVDGALITTSASVPVGSTAAIHVGYSGGMFAYSSLDEPFTADRPITPAEIARLHQIGRGF